MECGGQLRYMVYTVLLHRKEGSCTSVVCRCTVPTTTYLPTYLSLRPSGTSVLYDVRHRE
jgi:hypothetical protein